MRIRRASLPGEPSQAQGRSKAQGLARSARDLLWLLVLMLVGVSLASCMAGCTEPARRDPTESPRARKAVARSATPAAATVAATGESWLRRSEALGGHTLRKHVGRTDAELIERLRAEPHISASSTFTDEETAENAVRAAIAQNQSAIDNWLGEAASQRLPIDYRGNAPIGRGIRRGDPEVGPRTGARVILQRDGARGGAGADEAGGNGGGSDGSGAEAGSGVGPAGFHVLTAYPQ